MSPLLSDSVRIALAPDKVAGVRVRRGLPPRLAGKYLVDCRESRAVPAWAAAVEALSDIVAEIGDESAKATLIVSSRFVRYALVPWSDNLSQPSEELAYARHCFTAIHGDEAESWELRLSSGGVGEARVASAVDRELLAALRQVFSKSRLRLRSIQPYLMAALNLCRRRLGPDCLFLAAESRVYTCAGFRAGRWCSVHTGIINGGLADELPVILDREIVWSEITPRPPVFIFAADEPRMTLPYGEDPAVTSLPVPWRFGYSPLADAGFGMVMSAD